LARNRIGMLPTSKKDVNRWIRALILA